MAEFSDQPVTIPDAAPLRPERSRMVSLDAFRGITMAFMILVNTAGDGNVSYAQLRHSVWNGCTLTDLVFPTFLFLVGVSMTFSLGSSSPPGSAAARFKKATRRSALLILIGLVLNVFPFFNIETMRYCGVLQRIGITYWLAAILMLVADIPMIAVVCALILAGYWALMTLVPVPGFGKTGLELGVLDPVANLASTLDRIVIPAAHRYHHTFYDPEGLLSTLPALASVLLGVLAGCLLRWCGRPTRLAWLATWGVALAGVGLLWSAVFPFNLHPAVESPVSR